MSRSGRSNFSVRRANRLGKTGGCVLLISAAAVLAGSSWSTALAATTPPDLLTAGNFAVLAGSAITNTGSTVINGDLGLYPQTAVTGFPPGVVNGAKHVNDAVAQQAQTDLTTAYNTAAGQTPTQDLTGQDLGGKTLTPGVYHFSSSAGLTGTVTLDAQGTKEAQFIFQIGSTLTTAKGSRVVLVNAADGCDVWWQVGSSATLGTSTVFRGNLMALTSITLTTGVNIASGRALARNGALTLDTNNVSLPRACATSSTPSPSPSASPSVSPSAGASPAASPGPSPSSSPRVPTPPNTGAGQPDQNLLGVVLLACGALMLIATRRRSRI